MSTEAFEKWLGMVAPQVAVFTILAAKGAIKLEAKGLKHSRGSVRKHWAGLMGLKPRASHETVIAAMEAELGKLTV